MRVPESNYRFFLQAMRNEKHERMPIYEHNIDAGFIQKVIDVPMVKWSNGTPAEQRKFMKHYVDFWVNNGYDTVSYELGIPLSCPGSGCLRLHTPPVLTTPESVEDYPWDKIEDMYFA